MPLVTPSSNESKDDFMSRCLDAVKGECSTTEECFTMCTNLYEHSADFTRAALSVLRGDSPPMSVVSKFRAPSNNGSYDVEVFAVGTWNSFTFTESDLENIVEAYNDLHSNGYLDAPLKLGHDEKQPLTDGMPAIGWVDKLYLKKDDKGRTKLMATFIELPDIVYQAAKNKLYKKVSVELEFDVKHKGKQYPIVLTAVSLLGSALPAVNTLADIAAYMGRGSMTSSSRAMFSTTIKINEDRKMAEIDDKELAELRAKALKADELEVKVTDFAVKEKQAKAGFARTTVNQVLDQGVKDMCITPAQRAHFAKMLKVDDDEAVVALSVDDVKALIPEKPVHGDKGNMYSKDDHHRDTDNTDEELDVAVRKIIADNSGKVTYTRALEIVMGANPELAKKHLGLTQ